MRGRTEVNLDNSDFFDIGMIQCSHQNLHLQKYRFVNYRPSVNVYFYLLSTLSRRLPVRRLCQTSGINRGSIMYMYGYILAILSRHGNRDKLQAAGDGL